MIANSNEADSSPPDVSQSERLIRCSNWQGPIPSSVSVRTAERSVAAVSAPAIPGCPAAPTATASASPGNQHQS